VCHKPFRRLQSSNGQSYKSKYFSYEKVGRSGILSRPENTRRVRGRSKLTWEETIKRDLKEWNISKELALDRNVWKITIHVPEP
jgi:hypothetical protein